MAALARPHRRPGSGCLCVLLATPAGLTEPPPTLDRAMPVEQLTSSMPPPPLQSATAASPSEATLSAVSRPPPGKDRMLLAGPAAEPAASVQIEQDGPRPHLPAPPSEPAQAEPPGNASALPASRFGPDSF